MSKWLNNLKALWKGPSQRAQRYWPPVAPEWAEPTFATIFPERAIAPKCAWCGDVSPQNAKDCEHWLSMNLLWIEDINVSDEIESGDSRGWPMNLYLCPQCTERAPDIVKMFLKKPSPFADIWEREGGMVLNQNGKDFLSGVFADV